MEHWHSMKLTVRTCKWAGSQKGNSCCNHWFSGASCFQGGFFCKPGKKEQTKMFIARNKQKPEKISRQIHSSNNRKPNPKPNTNLSHLSPARRKTASCCWPSSLVALHVFCPARSRWPMALCFDGNKAKNGSHDCHGSLRRNVLKNKS